MPVRKGIGRLGGGLLKSTIITSKQGDEKKTNIPEDFDIDMDNPQTEKAAVAIQSQFRKFQKKKQDVKS
uniref:Purkinje cell protein 4 n=1 Tax=Hippocampus comes TaxID=109280 RepID=A0A3Q2XZN5_HIPCM